MTNNPTKLESPTPVRPGLPPTPITVEVFSDVICPWCWVGSRRLTEGIALFTADPGPAGPAPVHVRWLPFQLNPDMPVAGMDRREYRSAKFGSWAHSKSLDAQVAAAGARDGLEFRHELMTRTPNTRAAHRLVWATQELGLGQVMVDRLFAGYFTQGRDIGDPDVLAGLGTEAGLTRTAATEAAAGAGAFGQQAETGVTAGLARGRALGITGVPFTLFAGRYALPPGAPPAEAVARVLRAVRQEDQQNQHHQQDQQDQEGQQHQDRPAAAPGAGRGASAGSCDLEGTCR